MSGKQTEEASGDQQRLQYRFAVPVETANDPQISRACVHGRLHPGEFSDPILWLVSWRSLLSLPQQPLSHSLCPPTHLFEACLYI